jgi:secreted trypsin-like serine protease
MTKRKVLSYLFSLGLLFAANTSYAIIDGQAVDDGSVYAKRVAHLSYGDDKTHACTGVLISPTVLLTAAHCIIQGQKPMVYFGSPSNTRPVSQVKVMETYRGAVIEPTTGSVPGDIALVQIGDSMPSGYQVSELLAANDPIDSSTAIVLGYGGRQFNAPAGLLRQASVNLTTAATVGDSIHLSPELVTGGDSGGPVFVLSNGKVKIYGVNCTAIRQINAFSVKDITQYRDSLLSMMASLQ